MDASAKGPPEPGELFVASLVGNMLTYLGGVLVYAGMLFSLGYDMNVSDALQGLMMFLTFGLIVAFLLGLFIVGPLAMVIGLGVLKLPAGWWQGPLTGALTMLIVEFFVIFVVSREPFYWEWGNAIMLSWPVVLAMIAGAIVQRKMLKWPNRSAA